MKVLLVDTNIVSILFKRESPLYRRCADAVRDSQCHISFMTRAELLLWPQLNSWGGQRRLLLEQHIREFTTLLPDEEECSLWAGIVVESRMAGRPMSDSDAWIAATAKRWRIPLLTDNYKDFEHLREIEVRRL